MPRQMRHISEMEVLMSPFNGLYQSTIHVNVRLYAASNTAYKRNGGAYVTL
jgi:hypothetical protein